MDEETNTYPTPALTFEELERTFRSFRERQTDRMPAIPREIRVHPDFYDVFIADLREAGVDRGGGVPPLLGLPVYQCPWTPFGVKRVVYPDGHFTDC